MNDSEPATSGVAGQSTIDELLDRAIKAINDGDRATASMLAEKVLAVDGDNAEAEDLLAAPMHSGEIRRLTIMFADLVDSTALSTRIEPEIYRTVVGRYRDQVRQIVERYEGHIASTKGDGLLAVFGHPTPHENDARRAVQAGLDIARDVAKLSQKVQRRFGFGIDVRVGIHRGLCYLDIVQDDVYGLAANLASRVSGLAPAGGVVVSGAIEPLIRHAFDTEPRPAQHVKGIEGPVEHHVVLTEKAHGLPGARGPIVGRDGELADLEERWGRARAGTLTDPALGFVAEPGMGKSRLATAVADLAEQAGRTVLALLGSPLHGDAGLHPVRMMLESRCEISRSTTQPQRLQQLEAELNSVRMDTAAAIPLLAPVLGIPPEVGFQAASAEGTKLYAAIRDAIRDYMVACMRGESGVVLVEDLQWFDASTLDVVRALLETDTGRLLIVLTARDELSTDLPVVDICHLAPLTESETDALVDALRPGLSAEQHAEVRRRCDGVPLYIEEVVAKADEPPDDSSPWTRVPDALYEPLFARLRRSANAIPVVEAAATIGRDVDRAVLIDVVGMADDEFDSAMSDLISARVVAPSGNERWRFRHELLREVAAELAPPSQRRLLHAKIAEALVSSSTGQPDWNLVAQHHQHAEQFGEAALAFQSAAGQARHRGALAEARGHLSQAVRMVEQMPPGPDRNQREMAVRLRRGFLTFAAQGPASPGAAADFERCLQLGETDLTGDFYYTLIALFAYYMNRGDLRRATLINEFGQAELERTGEGGWVKLAARVATATTAWYSGDIADVRAQLEALAAEDHKIDVRAIETVWFMPHEPLATAHTLLALARFIQGDMAGTAAALAATRERCDQLPFPHGPSSQCYAHSLAAWMQWEAGNLAEANDRIADVVGIAERFGLDTWQFLASAERTAVDALAALAKPVPSAELDPHIAQLTALVDLMRALELKAFLATYDAVLARVLIASGDLDAARCRMDLSLELCEDTGIRFYEAELRRLRAHTQTGDGRAAELREAIDTADRQGATIFGLRAAIDYFELLGVPARDVLVAAVDRFPGDSDWPALARARALLA